MNVNPNAAPEQGDPMAATRDETPEAEDPQTGIPHRIRPFVIREQGHFHIRRVSRTDRRPGFRGWYIETEQKRPHAIANEQGGEVDMLVTHRDEGTIGYRDGEDGSQFTLLTVKVPRAWFGRAWRIETIDDKWGIQLVCWTTWFPNRSPWFKLREAVERRWYLLTHRHQTYKPSSTATPEPDVRDDVITTLNVHDRTGQIVVETTVGFAVLTLVRNQEGDGESWEIETNFDDAPTRLDYSAQTKDGALMRIRELAEAHMAQRPTESKGHLDIDSLLLAVREGKQPRT